MHGLTQARKLGLIRYAGKPCPHCSSRVRYVSSRTCCFCAVAMVDKATMAARKRAYRARIKAERLAMATSPIARLYLEAMTGRPWQR